MKSLYAQLGINSMLRLNLISLLITTFCEIFAIFIFVTKAYQPEVTRMRYTALLLALVVVSLLFLGSLASMIYFIMIKNRTNKKHK